MLMCIEGVALPPCGNIRNVETFAYCREESGEDSVKAANHARHLVKIITHKGNIHDAEPPREQGYDTLWIVEVSVSGVHRDKAEYSATYRKFNGCPLHIIKEMMRMYATIKKIIRNIYKDMNLTSQGKRKKTKCA
jgi:hypothetical protein